MFIIWYGATVCWWDGAKGSTAPTTATTSPLADAAASAASTVGVRTITPVSGSTIRDVMPATVTSRMDVKNLPNYI